MPLFTVLQACRSLVCYKSNLSIVKCGRRFMAIFWLPFFFILCSCILRLKLTLNSSITGPTVVVETREPSNGNV